ncbi:HAMP domain-containing protein [Rhodospirillales bacterium URHD0017]|nr:HAMP domain-containing protein [Rhodospirillales bacterium URHD0017]
MSGLFTIRSYLMLMIAAIIVPMMTLVAILAWNYGAAGRRTIEAERLDVAHNLTHLMDRDIRANEGFLAGVAASLAGPRISEAVISSAMASGFSVLVVHDRAGRQAFAAPAEADVAPPAAALGVDEVIAGRGTVVSGFVAGSGSLKPGLFFVSVPVLVDGQVAYVLSGGMMPQRLQTLFAEAGLHQGWTAGIVDRQGIILARTLRPELYVGGFAQKAMVEVVHGKRTTGLFDIVSRDGVDVKNSFQRSAVSGWTAAVAVPASVVNAPLYRTALSMAAVGLALTLLSLFLGSLVAGRISRAVQQLGMASAAFASGHAVPLPSSMLTELQDVAQAMEVSAERAKRREAMARQALRER